ncbi:MAG: putative membrane protein YphA (DoxX/SURF4 family), partial [Parvicellaceae bacterium]
MQSAPRIGQFFYFWISGFCLLFIFSFPVAFEVLPDFSGSIGSLITPILVSIGHGLFGLSTNSTESGILSDSANMYLLCFLCSVVSLLLAIIWVWKLKEKLKIEKWTFWFLQIARYYLVIQMFQYGLNKLFKFQFYFPEPNTLFTTIGNSTKDILFWSSMGSSYEYTVFAGLIEILAASLLLFRKTRVLGALLLSGIMINVIMI